MFRTGPIVVALLLAAPLRAGVLVVDAANGPGTDFTSLQAATSAAASGDMLLVRSGAYAGLLIDGKSLSVVADAGADVQVAFTAPLQMTEVRNLSAGQTVLLQGLQLRAIPMMPTFTPYNGCFVHDCAGTVWLDDCVVEFGAPALRVQDCARVIVAGGSILGTQGSVGLELADSDVVVVGSTVLGGDGHDAGWGPFMTFVSSTPGGVGVRVAGTSSTVTLAGCTVHGGDGGAGFWFFGDTCGPPSNGGDGLVLDSTGPFAAIARLAGPLPLGGAAGGSTQCGQMSAPGIGINTLGGSVMFLSSVPATLTAAGPVREGESLAVNVQGQAGDLAWVVLSPLPGGKFLYFKQGDLLLAPPFTAVTLGPLPAGGALALSAHVPELGPGVEGLAAFAQVVTCGAGCRMGTGSALVLLDGGL